MYRNKNSAFIPILSIFLLLIMNGCATTHEEKIAPKTQTHYFENSMGCFLLYDLKAKTFKKIIGNEICKQRFVACSTFKVPLALMAFDAGVLKNENQVIKWNGKMGFLESHNKDHNARTWIKDSVVWFSQRLTPILGKRKIEKYLNLFQYGNQDFSGGLTDAWLVSPSAESPALKISAYEQVEFFKNLWTDQLPVSKRASKITRELTYLETSPNGFKLSGKTGSNYYDNNINNEFRRSLGWFVSHLEKDSQEYIVVTNLSDTQPTAAKNYGGLRAKQITIKILADEGLW